MAIDPYRKSRRIRNVIHVAREVLSSRKLLDLVGDLPASNRDIIEIEKDVARILWKRRDCYIWQGEKNG